MKLNNKKKIILGSIIGILLGSVVSVTYAFFSYSTTGANQQLVAGDIYMHYKETNELVMENTFPSSTYDANKYFEFTVDGKNTNTQYDIVYDVVLNHGTSHPTRDERIDDKFLKFTLKEKKTGENEWTTVINGASYQDLSSGLRIWVDTINKNQTSEVVHTYRLYMWIDDSVVIGNEGTPGIDYDMTTWNTNIYGSIKVNVTGDFSNKVLPTEIVLNPNGGTISTGVVQIARTATTYGTLPEPTLSGYSFNGWYTAATGGTEVTSSTSFTYGTSPQTLYAHWGEISLPTMAEMCPNCKFMYVENNAYYFGDSVDDIEETVSTNYLDIVEESGKNYFLGFTESDGIIDSAFACVIKAENPNQGTPFCIEGWESAVQSSNQTFLNAIYGAYNSDTGLGCHYDPKYPDSHDYYICNGTAEAVSISSVGVYATVTYYPSPYDPDNPQGLCTVSPDEGEYMTCVSY